MLNDVSPADGSREVPRNLELRVSYGGDLDPAHNCSRRYDELRVVSAAGDAIVLEAERRPNVEPPRLYTWFWPQVWFVARPSVLLQPETDYTLQVRVPGNGGCLCDVEEWHDVSSFTTAVSEDSALPTFSGEIELDYGEVRQGVFSSCGAYHSFDLTLTPKGADDDSGGLRYNLYVGGERTGQHVAPADLRVAVTCVEDPSTASGFTAYAHTVEVRAVDIAGNESPPHAATAISDLCAIAHDVMPAATEDAGSKPLEPPDAGTTLEADGGRSLEPRQAVPDVHEDATAGEDSETDDAPEVVPSDCSALAPGPSSGVIGLALLALLRRHRLRS